MNNRKKLEKQLKDYPDIINLSQLREILNGINYKNAKRILKSNGIRFFATDENHKYNIVKKDVFEYMLSEAFEQDKLRFPTLNLNNKKYLVIRLSHPEFGVVYHRRSHGHSETKTGSYLSADIKLAKKYSQLYRAELRLEQMLSIYGNICEIIEYKEEK